MSVILTLFPLLFIGCLILGLLYLVYLRDESQRAPWQHFAVANNLNFVSGVFLKKDAFVFGDYRGHHLVLDTFLLYQGRRVITYTRLTLFARLAVAPRIQEEQLNTQGDPLARLKSIHFQYPLKGQVNTIAHGQTISYTQPDLEVGVNYLQALSDLLSDVADTYPGIVALGGGAVPSLQAIATNPGHILSLVALQLLQDIAQETTDHLSHRARNLLCPQCLVSFAAHQVSLPSRKAWTYYGCRICGQSREFIEVWVVAVLDQEMTLEQVNQGEILRVNWLIRRTLFDFDEVEIVRANDEDIERFAVQVGNDTDIIRQPSYKEMRCVISSNCELSENTKRILQHMFGQVKVKEVDNESNKHK